MKRIVVIGATGSGKTTLAMKLGAKLNLPMIDLDDLYWLPGWQPTEPETFQQAVAQATAGERWIANGNYNSLRSLVWGRADTLIWLDYKFPVVLWRLLKRSMRRIFNRQPCCNGNFETCRRFLSNDSILLWLFKSYGKHRRDYAAAFGQPAAYPLLRFIRLRGPAATLEFLRTLPGDHELSA